MHYIMFVYGLRINMLTTLLIRIVIGVQMTKSTSFNEYWIPTFDMLPYGMYM